LPLFIFYTMFNFFEHAPIFEQTRGKNTKNK